MASSAHCTRGFTISGSSNRPPMTPGKKCSPATTPVVGAQIPLLVFDAARESLDERKRSKSSVPTGNQSRLVSARESVDARGDDRSLQADLVGFRWPLPVAGGAGGRNSRAPAPTECAPPQVPWPFGLLQH